MIDLHVHLLPDWDDGAATLDEARAMAEVARRDGITKIAVTPHIFRITRHDGDWAGLADRMARFKEAAGGFPCEIYPGAEVFIRPDIAGSLRRYNLTINGSDYFFIEFAAEALVPGAKEFLFSLMLEGFIPIISHPERNAEFQARPRLLYEMVKMNCLAQVTARSILGGFGPEAKRAAEVFLKHNLAHIIASDAHDHEHRPPRLSRAVEEAAKITGKAKAEAMVTEIPQAILDNREIGEWGEAENPERGRKTWMVRLPWKK
jgi:protein-tyrosine phosphatase